MNNNRRSVKFVRMLLKEPKQFVDRGIHFLENKGEKCSLPLEYVRDLRSQGVLVIDATGGAFPCVETRQWLKRQKLKEQSNQSNQPNHQANHSSNDIIVRLAKPAKGGTPYLEPHHLVAADRFCNVFARAQLRTSVTQNIEGLAMPKAPRGFGGSSDLSDMAIDHRAKLDKLFSEMPADCRSVLVSVCGFEKGLQRIEFEMGWPRRSAKLVLRMALDQVAIKWGLDKDATGPNR